MMTFFITLDLACHGVASQRAFNIYLDKLQKSKNINSAWTRYIDGFRLGTYTIADFWGIGSHGVPFNKNIASEVSLVIDNQENLD